MLKLPSQIVLEDIKKLVDDQSQIDPSFKSQRLYYTRLSASIVRHQLIEKFGYGDEELPTSQTIRVKLKDRRADNLHEWRLLGTIKYRVSQLNSQVDRKGMCTWGKGG